MNIASSSPPASPTYHAHRLEGLPPEAFYVPSFITEYEEEYLLKRVRSRSNYIGMRDEYTDNEFGVAGG
jgi:hypothetical protein